ncbi:MAG: carboxypeptidase regulatory-like domain-containing protein [Thermoplasmata archaeon]|nr:MAG: carboxypeptidase regulatory-like domain-containing protein [Thermoplasmata archaeon]
MKKRSILIGILGVVTIVGLLSAAGLAAAQEHQISGYVYEEGTSFRISGAEVNVEGEDSRQTWTDGNGYYSVWVPDGGYTVTVSADGYHDEDNWVSVSGQDVNRDFYLTERETNGNGGGFDGDGDGDGEEEDVEDMFGDLGDIGSQVGAYVTLCMSLIIILLVSIFVMAIASVGIFVRLGKIKKELKNSQIQQSPGQYQQPQHSGQQAPPPPPAPAANPGQPRPP